MSTKLNLQLFANPSDYTQTTLLTGLSNEMKTFYDMTLLDNATPNLVHDQFGQKRPIPANGGKTIEFRRFGKLDKALTPITEGVTPAGNSLSVTTVTATVAQYGDYIVQSDILELTALDNTILEATKLLGSQAGLTLDTITRNVIIGGTGVMYASKWSGTTETTVELRENLDKTAALKVDTIQQAVARLRAANTPTINGKYVGIIHPYVAYDLMRDPEWIDAHKYTTSENLYAGEIGEIGGVRFVQTTEAKIYAAAEITGGFNKLTCKTSSDTNTVQVEEELEAGVFSANKDVYINGTKYTARAVTVTSGVASLVFTTNVSISAGDKIYGTGVAKDGSAVFCTLILGEGAYGTTEVTGGGLQTIVKQKGSAGSADPLKLAA